MNKQTISKAIYWLRFPLMVAVVCIHTDLRVVCPIVATLPIFGPFIDVFKSDICFPVLNVFFFIAGFYFFKECHFNLSIYFTKLKKRFKSLFIPYILWNGIAFVAVCLCQMLTNFMPLLHKHISDFRWYDFLFVFWDKQWVTGTLSDSHAPLLLQFWFVQCLMVAIVLSPIIWVGLKRLGWLFLLLLGILLAIYPNSNYAGIRMEAFFFFAVGGYFQLHKQLWNILSYPWILALSWVALWFAMHFVPVLSIVYSMVYALLIISIAIQCLAFSKSQESLLTRLGKASFFIFGFHIFLAQPLLDVCARLPIHWNDAWAFVTYFMIIAINVALCLLVYGLMKKFVPKFLSLLVGGR